MHNTKTRTGSKILLLAAAAGTLAVSASGVASASSEPPGGSMPPGVVAAGEASSPEAAAFCEAELAMEAAFGSEDPALIGPAIDAVMAAAPADVLPVVEAALAAEEESPEFEAAYGELIAWMQENCGFAQLNITGSDYAFGGLPDEVPAGPAIMSLANVGVEVHELLLLRINDDVTLTVEELIALSEEEGTTMTTFAGHAFAYPGEVGQTVVDLTPGRYVAVCFLPEGATPEMMEEMMNSSEPPPDASAPPSEEQGPPPHAFLGMVQEFTVV